MYSVESACQHIEHRGAWSAREPSYPLPVCLRKESILIPSNKRQGKDDSAQQEQSIDPEKNRVLLLSGSWTMPGNRYEFTATVYMSAGGAADGLIRWHATTVWHKRQEYSGTEQARGHVTSTSVELEGYRADPQLAPDYYKLQLVGDTSSGTFRGISRTCLGNWSGRAWGTYVIFDRWPQ